MRGEGCPAGSTELRWGEEVWRLCSLSGHIGADGRPKEADAQTSFQSITGMKANRRLLPLKQTLAAIGSGKMSCFSVEFFLACVPLFPCTAL